MEVRCLMLIAVSLCLPTWLTPAHAFAQSEEPACPREGWYRGEDGDCHAPASTQQSPEQIRGVESTPAFEAEDVVLFPVRALLLVPRLVTLGLLLPVRAGVEVTERHAVLERSQAVFYNHERNGAVLPLVTYQSGFGLGAGATAFHDDLFGNDESISAEARFGGRYAQAYELRFAADHLLGGPLWADLVGRWEAAPSLVFAGIGPDREPAAELGLADARSPSGESFYAQRRTLGVLGGGVTLGSEEAKWQPGVQAVVNHRNFDVDPRRDDRVPIDEVYDVSTIPGFDQHVTTVELDLALRVELGRPHGLQRRGLYGQAFVGWVPGADIYQFGHFGSELAWSFGLWRPDRILTIRAAYEGVAGAEDEIPFSELPRLGGPDRLRGYIEDRFRDRHAGLATLQYDYPIHANVSGSLFVDAGSVGPEPLDLAALRQWRLGYGGGLLLGSDSGVAVRLNVAGGDGLHFYLATDLARAFESRTEEL